MKDSKSYIGLGGLLVALGVLFLLQNFNVITLDNLGSLLWGALFGVAGLAFLWVFASDLQKNWWAIIPGLTLLALALLIAFGELLGEAGGALFLGAIGLSFWIIYALRREHWWAIIPGGVLVSLAIMVLVTTVVQEEAVVGIFFLGLAATFGLVYLLPDTEKRMTWALIPAGVLAIMGLLFVATLGGIINYVWPLALILGGGYLVVRALRKRSY